MLIQENISLKHYNTFGIDVLARFFVVIDSVSQLEELFQASHLLPSLVLGGGSNILFTKNVDGLVLKNQIIGIEKVGEDDTFVYIRSGAGENWHQLVLYCIHHGYSGVENLSLIPGSVGAAPMQNIGAYGVELKDIFFELSAYDIKNHVIRKFSNEACQFGYRESIFKKELKNQFFITSVTLRLRKQPLFNTRYGAIEQQLKEMNVQALSIKAISDAVIHIRTSKLPDPAVIGNAGSFFKNPVVSVEKWKQLQEEYPELIAYEGPDGYKLAAGWLIERCGFKGYRMGDAGCHAKQALVLVNYGHASGNEIVQLSNQIIDAVKEKFGITLAREVNLI